MRLLPITAIYRIVMKTLGKKKNGEKVGKKKYEKKEKNEKETQSYGNLEVMNSF